jgi:hypothetical protein
VKLREWWILHRQAARWARWQHLKVEVVRAERAWLESAKEVKP